MKADKPRTLKMLKVPVPVLEGYEFICADQLIRCEADDNYTHLFLKNKTTMTACRTLKEMEALLAGFPFFIRVHHSAVVNLNEVDKYIRGQGGYLVMSDKTVVNVSRARKPCLLKYLSFNYSLCS